MGKAAILLENSHFITIDGVSSRGFEHAIISRNSSQINVRNVEAGGFAENSDSSKSNQVSTATENTGRQGGAGSVLKSTTALIDIGNGALNMYQKVKDQGWL